MCTADGAGCALAASGAGFESVADALRAARAAAAYLNSPAAADLGAPARPVAAVDRLGPSGVAAVAGPRRPRPRPQPHPRARVGR